MPEEQNAAPQNEDTPQVETPAPAEDTQEDHGVVDYRNRYDNLRQEFTRKSQRLAELEARLAEQESQYEEDDDDLGGYEEYSEDEFRRLARKEAEALLSARDRREAELQADEDYINAEIAALEKSLKEDFDEKEWQHLGDTAWKLRDENGRPDVKRAYEDFTGLFEARKKKWVSGKRSARPTSGPGAAELVDLDDSQQRAAFIDRIYSEHTFD